MRRATKLGLAGLAVVGLSVTVAGPLRARQGPEVMYDGDCRPIQPDTHLVPAPPHSVAWTRTWLQLQRVESLEYPDGVKLGDLLKRVRESTRAPEQGFPRGVSIYLNPNDLAEVDRTIDSMMTLDLDGVALAKALTLALRQLGLAMRIDEDGLVIVTSTSGDDDDVHFSADEAEWTRLDHIHRGIRGISSQVIALRREVSLLREALHQPAPPSTTAVPTPPDAPVAPAPATGGGFR